MKVIHKLRMDLARCGCKPIVGAVQGEANTRVLEIELFNNGIAWEPPAGVTAAVAFKKPDGTKGLYDKLPDGLAATSIDGVTVTAILAPQVLTCAGAVLASIIFKDTEGDTLATFPFKLTVEENPAAASDLSNDYFNPSLEELHADIVALNDQLDAAIQELNTARENGELTGYSVYYTDWETSNDTTAIPLSSLVLPEGRVLVKGDLVITVNGILYSVLGVGSEASYCTRLTSLKGDTPVKGVDYFTEEDQAEMVADVLASEKISTMQQAIEDLQYVPIKFTNSEQSVYTVEMGTTVEVFGLRWQLNKLPTSLVLSNGQELEVTDTYGEVELSGLAITKNKTYKLTATDERGTKASENYSITFLNGVYYGVLKAGATLDSAAILTLTRNLQSSRAITFKADAAADQQIVYAFPSRLSGTPTFSVGGFEGGFSKAATIDFTNASGYTESYDIWTSDNVGLGSTTVKVS